MRSHPYERHTHRALAAPPSLPGTAHVHGNRESRRLTSHLGDTVSPAGTGVSASGSRGTIGAVQYAANSGSVCAIWKTTEAIGCTSFESSPTSSDLHSRASAVDSGLDSSRFHTFLLMIEASSLEAT